MSFISIQNLEVSFRQRKSAPVKAVQGVSFEISKGETLGLVGESGCGKTTLSRAILGLVPFTGSVEFDGEILDWSKKNSKLRQRLQLIFQDPYASLNPRLTVGQTVEEPLIVHTKANREERRLKVRNMIDRVELTSDALAKYPHEFSGGQRQRVAIARALILEPDLVIADEPVSALDVSVQAHILNLLQDLRKEMGLTLLFISHDLSVVRHVSDRVAVMYNGKIVEEGNAIKLMDHPSHPYTQKLVDAVPRLSTF